MHKTYERRVDNDEIPLYVLFILAVESPGG